MNRGGNRLLTEVVLDRYLHLSAGKASVGQSQSTTYRGEEEREEQEDRRIRHERQVQRVDLGLPAGVPRGRHLGPVATIHALRVRHAHCGEYVGVSRAAQAEGICESRRDEREKEDSTRDADADEGKDQESDVGGR